MYVMFFFAPVLANLHATLIYFGTICYAVFCFDGTSVQEVARWDMALLDGNGNIVDMSLPETLWEVTK